MSDSFTNIAPYYDRIMEHVDYDRWFMVTTELATLLPRKRLHLEAACGTGTLLKRLRTLGWQSIGIDLSPSMLHSGIKDEPFPAATADVRALPFHNIFHYITCLFDSINFLTGPDDLARGFRSIYDALLPGGLFYFDAVTERMVTLHFEGQEWTERNGSFTTTWASDYDARSGIVETSIRINRESSAGLITERIFPESQIVQTLEETGFTVLGIFDAHSWKPPRKKSVRLDFIAIKKPTPDIFKRFAPLPNHIRRLVF